MQPFFFSGASNMQQFSSQGRHICNNFLRRGVKYPTIFFSGASNMRQFSSQGRQISNNFLIRGVKFMFNFRGLQKTTAFNFAPIQKQFSSMILSNVLVLEFSNKMLVFLKCFLEVRYLEENVRFVSKYLECRLRLGKVLLTFDWNFFY